MPTVPTTEELTITLPKEVADMVRARVADGNFSSPLDYVVYAIRADIDHKEAKQESWVRKVGVARYDAYDANPSDVFTAEEVRQAVADRLHPVAVAR